eukprot:scaffold4147_cov114-Isochrysis_galbana.AAC.7
MAACPRRSASPVAIPAPVVAAVPRTAKKQCVCVWGRCASRTPGFLSGGSLYVSKRTLADPQIGHQSKR